MKKVLLYLFLSLSSMVLNRVEAHRSHTNFTVKNPVVPGYFADPSIFRDDDGCFYIYSTTDGYDEGKFTNGPLGVWKSKDFVNWTFHNFAFPNYFPYLDNKLWAPSATRAKNGKYYIYFVKKGYDCFVASSNSPLGPWKEENDGKPVFKEMFDAEVFRDTDGATYLVYQGPKKDGKYSVWLGKLKENMTEFESEPRMIYQNFDLFEGPGMFKRDGKYYLLYSAGGLGGTYHVNAAYSDSVWGPYDSHNKKGKAYNPIIKPIPQKGMISTGHNSVLKVGNQFYMIYHRKAFPYRKGSDLWRQVCAEKLQFESNGRLRSIKPTFEGIESIVHGAEKRENAFLGAKVSASSFKSDDFSPVKMVDNDFGSMWKASSNSEQTIVVNSKIAVKELKIFFEYPTEKYNYKVQVSKDGSNWIDNKDYKWNTNYPVVEKFDKKYKYLKINIKATSKSNQTIGVWEIIGK
jgi:beta-xylosidase